jgi:hypothetical protein
MLRALARKGTLTLSEEVADSSSSSSSTASVPIETQSRERCGGEARTMYVRLGATGRIELRGTQRLYAPLLHCFDARDDGTRSMRLVARAKQLSCFALLVGSLTAADQVRFRCSVFPRFFSLFQRCFVFQSLRQRTAL